MVFRIEEGRGHLNKLPRGLWVVSVSNWGGTTWTGDLKYREVKLDFFAERDKCKPVLMRLSLAGNLEKPQWDRMDGAWLGYGLGGLYNAVHVKAWKGGGGCWTYGYGWQWSLLPWIHKPTLKMGSTNTTIDILRFFAHLPAVWVEEDDILSGKRPWFWDLESWIKDSIEAYSFSAVVRNAFSPSSLRQWTY